MTNKSCSEALRERSLVIRWAVATAVVVAVGTAGFMLRGGHRSNPETRTTTRSQPAISQGDFAFPDIPEITVPDFGQSTPQPSGSGATAADFGRCEGVASEYPSDVPADWATYSAPPRDRGSFEFHYPSDWRLIDDSDQIGAMSPDGSRPSSPR
jgi:hypothetical protein